MEQERLVKTPNSMLAQMQVVHFGKILFNLQFIAVAIMFASVLSFVFTAVYYVMLVCISIFTVFTIYVWYPGFSSWWGGGETLARISVILASSWKYTIPIVLALSIGSIVCLCFDKNEKQVVRIVVSGIICALALAVLILKFINGGAV